MQNSGLVYNKIVDCLADCRHLIASSSCMNSTDKAICEVDKRMQEPMQLAIVGRISSSKSTLVNAILVKLLMSVGSNTEMIMHRLSFGSKMARDNLLNEINGQNGHRIRERIL